MTRPLSPRRLGAVLLRLLLALMPLRVLAAAPPAEPKSIRVVMDQDYPPYIFRRGDGVLAGILVDEWALWEQRTGVKVRLEALDWAKAVARMEAGDAEVIDTIFENPKRLAQYDFTPPYARIDVPLFFGKDLSAISEPKDLAGFVVGAKAGDNSVDLLRAAGVSNFMLFDNYEAIVAAARDGKVKVFTVDQPPALYYLNKMGIQDQFRQSRPLYSGEFHRAVRKGDRDLLALVQRGFGQITAPEREAIQRRWFGTPVASRQEWRLTAFIALGAAGVLAILLAWVWSLRRAVKRKTSELLASEMITRTISSNLTNGMIYQLRVEPDGSRRFTYLSDSVRQLYGVSPAEAMADERLIHGRIHPEDVPALVETGDQAISTLTPFRMEAKVLGPGDEVRWSSFVSTPRLLPDGATIWDGLEFIITDRKRGEEALRASEANYRSLVSAIPDLIFTFSPEGVYLSVHAQDPDLLVQPESELLGRNLTQVLPEPVTGEIMGCIRAALETRAVQAMHFMLVLGGEEKHFEARLAPCGAEQVICIVRDVSESWRLERQRLRLEAQLQQAQKLDSLGSLAGGIAHDINNVLGAILAVSSNLAERPDLDGSMSRALDVISKAATRGGQVVKGLLNFARQAPLPSEAVDLNAVLQEVARLLERTTLARIRMQLDLDPGLRPIQGDVNALTHACMNLCVNAVDAMDGEGTLTLRTRNGADGTAQVEVADTGSGMSPEVQQKALDPFFTTKAQGKGTGLGLSIVYGIVKTHRGTLEIESAPGRGTVILLRFPAAAPAPAGPEAGEPAQAPGTGPALGILLVDDDEFIRMSMEQVLSTMGHAVLLAASGEEALGLLEGGQRPDLVMLDMNMPGLGGAGTLPRLRGILPSVPVLIVTGKADQAAQELADRHERVALLPKPFTAEEIRTQLKRLTTEG
jgi:PAS domain S-box-containing protein